jgi:2-dehydropantoate 2-reductase
MGSLVAGLLGIAQEISQDTAKAEIWLIGSKSAAVHLETIQKHGLSFTLTPNVLKQLPDELAAKFTSPIRNLHVTQNLAAAYPSELALVLVKSYSTTQATQDLQKVLAPDGLALSLQNGLGNSEVLAEGLGQARVAQGTTMLGGGLTEPGKVLFAGLNQTYLGLDSNMSSERQGYLHFLKAQFERVNAPITLTANVQSLVWSKLVVNCAINPVAALLDVTNGELLEKAATRQLMTEIATEVAKVAEAKGIKLAFPGSEAANQAMEVARQTAQNYCSMVQDLRRGRPTEIEALNGAIVREAEKLGLAVPVNRTLTQLIRARQDITKGFQG